MSWNEEVNRAQQLLTVLIDLTPNDDENPAPEIIAQLLCLFRRNPDLTCQRFAIGTTTTTPLQVLLSKGALLEDIQTFFDICPRLADMLLEGDGFDILPIHYASGVSSEDIILLLAEKSPESLTKFESSGLFPLNCALKNENHNISFDTLRILLHACPEAVGRDDCISKAITKGCPLDFLEDMVKFYRLEIGPYIDHPLILNQVRIITRLLTKVTVLHLTDLTEDRQAFECLMQQVEQSDSIRTVSTGLPSLTTGNSGDREAAVKALQDTVAGAKSLKELHLYFREPEVSNLPRWIRAIQRGYSVNQALQSVRCTTSSSAADRRGVVFTVRKHRQDSPLRLPRWLTDEWVQRTKNVHTGKPYFYTQELEYNPSSFSEQCLHDLCLPGLTALTLNLLRCDPLPSQEDLTNMVLRLLREKHSFETLEMEGAQPDLLTLFEELKTNTQLKSLYVGASRNLDDESLVVSECLRLLKEHNSTLIECSIHSLEDRKIQYYLDLNRFGRAKARTADGRELVELLLQSMNTTTVYLKWTRGGRRDRSIWMAAKQSMVYGLLREAPSLWSQ